MTSQKAFICGCAGLTLSADEKVFLGEQKPWGFILFKRNCESKQQILELTAALRDAADAPQAPVFIDQEGGRVQRLGPPIWPKYPTGQAFADLYAIQPEFGERAVWLAARLIAHDLIEVGVDADCLPVLDVPVPGAHDVIGDRAYGRDPNLIAHLGALAASGLLSGGVLPVIKHIPGHGRAGADSHHELPVVDASRADLEAIDFHPFKKLNHLPMAMTAHVVYTALDETAPCSTSKTVIRDVIRELIGFQGLLMSDDVSMNALHGEIGTRVEACFAAGCDFVLHCNGKLDEMRSVAEKTPAIEGMALERAIKALDERKKPEAFDVVAGHEELKALISKL
ncbi:MAG: beta-N-acetylhexosaminidase [Hyphomicrobiales bacterium]